MNECSQFDEEIRFSYIFEQDEKNFIPWVNEDIFAARALNKISTKLLSYLPYYQRHPYELKAGVHVPAELGNVELTSPVNVLVCRANRGSLEVVREAQSILGRRNALFLTISDPIADADELEEYFSETEETISVSTQEEKKHVFVFYLNEEICQEDAEELTILLKRAIDLNIEIILLHELDPQRGGCEFGLFFQITPRELIDDPYKIYGRSIAIPLHGHVDYREPGLNRFVRLLGAKEVKKRMSANMSQKASC